MRQVLFIAIIAFMSFGCNNSGSNTESADSTAIGTDTVNSLNGTGTGADTMRGAGTDTTGRTGDTSTRR